MKSNKNSPVIAVGLDAAEPLLIRQMIEQGEMPTLKSLLQEGQWLNVKSPSDIGSGAVWPTFITGDGPAEHGIHAEWSWQPDTMSLRRYTGSNLQPFWKTLADQGFRVGILDVPFAPQVNLKEGFEIVEWGAHDFLEGVLRTAPDSITDFVGGDFPPHPFSLDRLDTGGPGDKPGLERLTKGCLEGAKLRGTLARRLLAMTDPNLAIIVFTEIHHSAHYLWHTVSPDDALYSQHLSNHSDSIKPGIKDIYSEIDKQIGTLLADVAPNSTVIVFSLHGMKPTHGVPAFLEQVLCNLGYARRADWKTQSWTERAISLMATVKRNTPQTLKRAYYRTLPTAATIRLARPTMMASYDWQRTRAFALPTDQHGWVRVNLKGREREGIVLPEDYDRICQELEQIFSDLRDAHKQPVVARILRTAKVVEEALSQRLPDLVLHWTDAAFAAQLKLQPIGIQSVPVGTKFTGQHALEGFCIVRSTEPIHTSDTLPATEMHRVIAKALSNGCG